MKTKSTLYVKVSSKVMLQDTKVRLGELCRIWSEDPAEQAHFHGLLLARVPEKGGRYVFSAIDILKAILRDSPGTTVEMLGEADVVADCRPGPPASRRWDLLKTILVCILTFTGGVFTIMTFNNDAQVPEILTKFYELVMGEPAPQINILHYSYAAGLFLGISIFFNHIAGWKVNQDPTPLEIQMRLYEQDVATTIVKNRERTERDADTR